MDNCPGERALPDTDRLVLCRLLLVFQFCRAHPSFENMDLLSLQAESPYLVEVFQHKTHIMVSAELYILSALMS